MKHKIALANILLMLIALCGAKAGVQISVGDDHLKLDRDGQIPFAIRVADRSLPSRPPMEVELIASDGRALHPEGHDIRFCLPAIFPDRPCHSRKEILSMDIRPVERLVDGRPQYARALMVHPTDYQLPEKEVGACPQFARLKSEKWGALTEAGQTAVMRFETHCGIMAIARYAQPALTSQFDEVQLNRSELIAVSTDDWPDMSEMRKKTRPSFERSSENPQQWSGETASLRLRILDVALADFDDDGAAERLLLVSGRARGGSARFMQFMLMEKDQNGTGLRPVIWK